MTVSRFDALFVEAAPRFLDGTHDRDVVPDLGGRWPVSMYLRPPADVAAQLAAWCEIARGFAGDGHFETGALGASHVTVRAVENRREAPATDPLYRRAAEAMAQAAASTPPLRLRLTGLGLTPIAVVATFEPLDETADTFRRIRLGEALGDDADAGEGRVSRRDIWHASVLHLTGDLRDADGLVRWVRDHRTVDPLDATLTTITQGTFRHRVWQGRQAMVPEHWDEAHFGG